MDNLLNGVILSVVYGILGMILLIGGYVLFDVVLKSIDFNQELKNKNVAVAIVIAGFMIAIGIIIASVVS
jgi:putative membrane protein